MAKHIGFISDDSTSGKNGGWYWVNLGGGLTIETPVIPSTIVFYSPVVSMDKLISLPEIPSTLVIHTLSLLKELSITLEHVSSTLTVHDLTILKVKLISLNRILPTVTYGSPTVLKDKLVELNRILSTVSIGNLEVLGGYRPVPDVKLYSAEGYGVHIRSVTEMNGVIQALVKRIELLEGH